MTVPRWVRISLWVVAAGVLVMMLVGGGIAVMIYRQTSFSSAERVDADREFERVKAQFPPRPPLVEVLSPESMPAGIRIHRAPAGAPRQSIREFQVLLYEIREKRLVRSHVPAWLMRFSSGNIALQLGLPVGDFTISLEDVEHYGRGIIIDFSPPDKARLLVWTE
jgi:hypothetical protein